MILRPLPSSLALTALLALSMGGLAACDRHGTSTTTTESQSVVMTEASPISPDEFPAASMSAPGGSALPADGLTPVSCADEIGATAADKRVKVCSSVSPATHPPCNTANSCAMIETEIARSCALLDGQGGPMAGCGPAPKSSEAAAAVITRYYSALNARDYDTAWAQWGDNGAPNQTLAKFKAGFTHTRSTHVTIGELEPAEGGAGSIYQSVPVIVDATLDDGTRQRFTGDYVVRRVNDVDGASAAQLRWHIDQAHLKAAPAT